MSNHLMISIPCRNEIKATAFPALVMCLVKAMAFWNRAWPEGKVTFSFQTRSHIVEARNLAVEQAREDDVDWVLWLDDDMVPPADLLERLFRHEKRFIGAVAYKRIFPYLPCVCRFNGDVAEHFDPEPGSGLIRADLTGFACVLTHRSVLDAVWDATEGKPFEMRTGVGEDFYFCAKARQLGIELWIDADTVVGHCGDLVVGRDERLRALAADGGAGE